MEIEKKLSSDLKSLPSSYLLEFLNNLGYIVKTKKKFYAAFLIFAFLRQRQIVWYDLRHGNRWSGGEKSEKS